MADSLHWLPCRGHGLVTPLNWLISLIWVWLVPQISMESCNISRSSEQNLKICSNQMNYSHLNRFRLHLRDNSLPTLCLKVSPHGMSLWVLRSTHSHLKFMIMLTQISPNCRPHPLSLQFITLKALLWQPIHMTVQLTCGTQTYNCKKSAHITLSSISLTLPMRR